MGDWEKMGKWDHKGKRIDKKKCKKNVKKGEEKKYAKL